MMEETTTPLTVHEAQQFLLGERDRTRELNIDFLAHKLEQQPEYSRQHRTKGRLVILGLRMRGNIFKLTGIVAAVTAAGRRQQDVSFVALYVAPERRSRFLARRLVREALEAAGGVEGVSVAYVTLPTCLHRSTAAFWTSIGATLDAGSTTCVSDMSRNGAQLAWFDSVAIRRLLEWDAVRVCLEGTPLGRDLSDGFRVATVMRHRDTRLGTPWEPWLLVAESAALRRIGKKGFGLYALRDFFGPPTVGGDGERITDHYPGCVVHSTRDIDCAASRAAVEKMARQCGDNNCMLLVARGDGTGVSDIVSGDGIPAAWATNACTGIPGVRKNVRFLKTGGMRATEDVKGLSLDFSHAEELDRFGKNELLTTYGAAYWRV